MPNNTFGQSRELQTIFEIQALLTREDLSLTHILQAVAEAGFVVVSLQHAGSDSGLLAGQTTPAQGLDRVTARRAGMNMQVAQARYGDVPFALDRLAEASRPGGSLAGRLDLSRVGMSGHSYGALSTLVAVGQRVLGAGPGVSFAEPRIKAKGTSP